ncbi:hypothetical protein ACTI_66040 [Actinoplanes sp. OR16]|uniref:protein phosphatase 2C domain-containing protein n=1 Tax=Actinoplanes sp. OR16 TaxID=946334 RepID=UPI000F719013|nr:protein phosphatase 2C domain-containing protein [Actinoplanes sp. OR16]BBH69919.1 hypothetical protein ACTI_66040 [Actinoplanes sp. OR16]
MSDEPRREALVTGTADGPADHERREDDRPQPHEQVVPITADPAGTTRAAAREQIPVRIQAEEPPPGPAELGEPMVLVGKPRLASRPGAFTAEPDAPPDSVIDGGDLEGLTVRAASLRGDEHRYYADPRQDAFAIGPLVAGKNATALLVCVADGVGSQPKSHLGSAAVTRFLRQEITPYAEKLLDPTAESGLRKRCAEVTAHVSQRLEHEAAQRQVPARALSTTLVAALIGPDTGGGHHRAVLLAVGDSPAFMLRDGQFEQIFGQSAAGELAGAATEALPSRGAEPVVMVADLGPGDVLVLCTDGLGNPMANSSVSDQLVKWWQGGPPSLPAFFWQMSFRAQSFGDDRTAVCVWIG